MRELPIENFLERLASRSPAPGGGASAAIHAAQGAALLAMVARYSDGAAHAAHAELIDGIVAEADDLRDRAVALAETDARAFQAVATAYRLPADTDRQRAERAATIAAALVAAARPPVDTIAIACRIVELAGVLLPVGNRNVITDVAAAAQAGHAAAAVSVVNVEVNLTGITDPAARQELTAAIAGVDALLERATRITARVRQEVGRRA